MRRRRTRGSCRRRRGRRARWRAPPEVDQGRTTAGDQAVDEAPQPHELERRLVAGVLDEQDRVLGQTRPWPATRRRTETTARLDSRAEDEPRRKAALPALEAEAGGVARHVGPVLVDDADDAERHPDPLHPQPVRPDPTVDHLADRVREGGHVPQPLRHLPRADLGQPEPVDRGRSQAVALGTARGLDGSPPGPRGRSPRARPPRRAGRRGAGAAGTCEAGLPRRALAGPAVEGAVRKGLRPSGVLGPSGQRSARISPAATRSSRWTTSVASSSGSSSRAPPSQRRSVRRAVAGEALGEHLAPGPSISTASPASKAPWHRTTPAGSSDRPAARQSPSGAVVDHDRPRRGSPRRRSTACGPAGGDRCGAGTPCRPPGSRRGRRRARPGDRPRRSPSARPTRSRSWPRPAWTPSRHCPRRSPDRPPAPRAAWSISTTSSISDASRRARRGRR